MKEKRNYRKPGLRSFGNDGIREDAAMAFLQAGSPTELTCAVRAVTQDVPLCEKDFCEPLPRSTQDFPE